jgi:hypothetical protein
MTEPTSAQELANEISFKLSVCNDRFTDLPKWEQYFIESISTQFDEKGTLSDRQTEKLEQIYDKL